ncbi:MAG: hypothetical protein IKG88_09305 [Bacteroidales bacterium]|nr:hypothetical protein [Bacteroidales bacterium]
MKKIALTLALIAFAFAANAQLTISANIGGNMTSGTVVTNTHITVVTDSSVTRTDTMENRMDLTFGMKIGYKFGKAQVGVAGSYGMYTIKNQPLDLTLVPVVSTHMPGWAYTGKMSTKGSSFMVAPYFRYDVLTAGDVALFVELDLFYSKVMNPKMSAEVRNWNIAMPAIAMTDTCNNRVVPRSTTSMGARVLPGLSWQLSNHCGIDLYLDFLSLAYYTSTNVFTTMDYGFHISPDQQVTYDVTATETITKTTEYGGGLTGTPLLTDIGVNNWVRVGFNLTF